MNIGQDRDAAIRSLLAEAAAADGDAVRWQVAVSRILEAEPAVALRLALEAAGSASSVDRELACYVIAQVRIDDRSQRAECERHLVALASDPEPRVVAAAVRGFGLLGSTGTKRRALEYATHESGVVRKAVAIVLGDDDSEEALSVLVGLTHDRDNEVRDMASFGLIEPRRAEGDAVLAALVACLSDASPEVRSNALEGLASRRHPSTADAIRKELRRDSATVGVVHAAERLGDPGLVESLEDVRRELVTASREDAFGRTWLAAIDGALETLRGKSGQR